MGVRAVIQATINSLTLATVSPISTGVISCVKMSRWFFFLFEVGDGSKKL